MIAHRIAACLLLTVTIRLSAEQPTTLPPPPPHADRAGATATWSPGHWQWTGSQWSWCPGSWRIERADGPRWSDGHWVACAGGTQWVAGHWQDDGAGAPAAAASAPPPSPSPSPQPAVYASQPVVYASQEADQAVDVERPVSSETVVVAPVYAPVYAPVCAPPPVGVGVHVGRALCLPLPPLLPLPVAGHHGFGFGRLPLPFFNPLSLLFHRH